MNIKDGQFRSLRTVVGGRSFRKQKTLPIDNAQGHLEKRGEKFSVKNLLYSVKLKQRVQKWLSLLPSRRMKLLTAKHFHKINDMSHFSQSEFKSGLIFSQEQFELDEDDINSQNNNKFVPQMTRQPTRSQFQGKRKVSSSKRIFEKVKKFIELVPVFNPNSLYKLFWDSILSLLVLIMSVVVPIKFAVQDFNLSYYLGSVKILSFVIILIVADVFISLNTAFFQRGKIEVYRINILKNYMEQIGVCDLLITQALLYELFYSSELIRVTPWEWHDYLQTSLLICLFYFKALKFHKFMFKIEETLSFKRRTLNILSLGKLLFFILKASHAFACLWLYTGRQMKMRGYNSWTNGLEDDFWSYQYIKSYYFICVTMTTIGYGDIVPKNSVEMIVSIFTMIIACVIFGYTINSIGSIFMELKKEDEEKKENVMVINRYMNDKNISRDLQSSIREYLEYYWTQQSNDCSEKEQHIFGQLSEDMRQALLLQANRIVLEDCVFFQRNFSYDVIQKSVHLIKQKKLTPNEYIINSSEDQSKNGILFFVEHGEVDIYQEFALDSIIEQNINSSDQSQSTQANRGVILNSQIIGSSSSQGTDPNKSKKKRMKRVQTLKKGQSFGEISFFTNLPNRFVAKSRNFSNILYIERPMFIEYLLNNLFNDDYQTFCHIKDSLIQNEFAILYQKCTFCGSTEHTSMNCLSVHYYPNRMITISRHNFSQIITTRSPALRRKLVLKNCLESLSKIQSIAQRFLAKNESFIEQNLNLFGQSDSQFTDEDDNENDEENYDEYEVECEDQDDNLSEISVKCNKRQINKQENESRNEDFYRPLVDKIGTHSLEYVEDFSKGVPLVQQYQQFQIVNSNGEIQSNMESQITSEINTLPPPLLLVPKRTNEQTDNGTRKKSNSKPNINLKTQLSQENHFFRSSSLKKTISLPFTSQQKVKGLSFKHQFKLNQMQQSPEINNLIKKSSICSKTFNKLTEKEWKPLNKTIDQQKECDLNTLNIKNEGVQERYQTPSLFQNWDPKFESSFEQMKIFKNYYPPFNYDKVIQRIKKKRAQEAYVIKPLSKWQKNINNNKVFQIVCNLFKQNGGDSHIIVQDVDDKQSNKNAQIESSQYSQRKLVKSLDSQKTVLSEIENPEIATNKLKPPAFHVKNIKFQPLKTKFSPTSQYYHRANQTQIINPVEKDTGFSDEDYGSLSKITQCKNEQKVFEHSPNTFQRAFRSDYINSFPNNQEIEDAENHSNSIKSLTNSQIQ